MNNNMRLSYQYSFLVFLKNVLLGIVFLGVAWVRFSKFEPKWTFFEILTIIVVLVFSILIGSQALYLCSAYLRNDKIVLKKLLRGEKTYTAKQIVSIKKINMRGLHYVMVTMRNVDGTMERFMILNIYTWYAMSKYNAEEVLTELQKN
ncbi:hypothetical protein [Myroides sp. N17-2]|uniref:hypothetical protein n=1 Tax=Myroides sp. N17-2 TaxID=2030799 RepID=UPI000EFB121D|nr:hypothetical protein [Myroides sp. N17-2]